MGDQERDSYQRIKASIKNEIHRLQIQISVRAQKVIEAEMITRPSPALDITTT